MNTTTKTNTMDLAAEILIDLSIDFEENWTSMFVNMDNQRELKITSRDKEASLKFIISENNLIQAEIEINTTDRNIIESVIAGLLNR